MSSLVPPAQDCRDLVVGDPGGSLEAAKGCFEALSAELAVASLSGLEEGDEQAHALRVEKLIPLGMALHLLVQGKELPDRLHGGAHPLQGGLQQVDAPKLIVLHGGEPAWSAPKGQDGKEAA